MNMSRDIGGPIEVIVRSGSPARLIASVANKLGRELRCHTLSKGHVADHKRITGRVVIIDAGSADTEILLAVSELHAAIAARLIILLQTATPEERVLARVHGVDHVIDQNTDERELAAMLRNELRHPWPDLASPRNGEEAHHWRLKPEDWVLIAPNDEEIRLSRSEYNLLELLINSAGTVQSRHLLRCSIEGETHSERSLDVVLSRLRRKVWDYARLELPIRCARGEGYVFARFRDAPGGTHQTESLSIGAMGRGR